jgi:tetratricopeptide (TPR) repeat protein
LKPKKPSPKKPRSKKKNEALKKPVFEISRRRRWTFRILAPVLILLLVGGGLESALRLCGYGYPASFFLKTEIGGKDYYVSNDRFGYRFFPPALARTPAPMRMAVKKPATTYRIFVFGESAAMGDPDPTFGAWRYLQVLLHERFPGTDFEVICVAMTAINSHVILPIARECARRDGDLWIIYMGNNEMVGPFGGGTVFGSRVAGIPLIRASLAVKSTKSGQLLSSLLQGWGHSSAPQTWSGLNMFKDHQLRYDDPNRLRACENFKQNLNDILRAGQAAGVPVILSTVGSNLKDCAPFGSLHSAGLNDSQLSEWDGLYQGGITLESSGDFPGALKKYEQAAGIDPQYAELWFRTGRCQMALTNFAQALTDFELARDDDTLVFRADSRINGIIQDAAAAKAGQGVYFFDAAKALAQSSPDGIPGNELFYEHVHLNFDGNYLLGRDLAEQTLKVLPKPILAEGKTGWASAELCDRRLAVTPWDRFRIWQENYSRVSEPPFTDQLNAAERAKFYTAKLQELNSQMTIETRTQSRATYEEALALSPDDYVLRENYAQFLDESGDLADAPAEEQQVSDMLPQNPMTPCIVGRLLVRLGDSSGAEKSFLR